MIQRIQSILLFLGAGSSFGFFGADIADTDAPVTGSALFADAEYNLFDDPVLLGIFGLTGVLLLVTIFLFKNRKLQMKLSLAAAGLVAVGMAYGAYKFFSDAAAEVAGPDFGLVFPFLIIFFALFAKNYIQRDEKLVRSADRLR